jgi:hypothetical protein
MERCLTDEEFARMTPEERRLYIDLLYAFIARRLKRASQGERQVLNAKLVGVEVTDPSTN